MSDQETTPPATVEDSPGEPKSKFARDLLASVVVFLVALPLCMGIAIASGVPPALGLVTGIVGGLVVGFLAGCPLQVSGPAAGLAVIVWEIVHTHGLKALGVIVLAAGLVQFLAGVLKLGRWFRAVSPAVIQGMLAGIGVLIFASQFHVMMDHKPQANGLKNLLTIPAAVRDGILPFDGSVHMQAAGIGLVTILTLVVWALWAPKKLKMIPGALIAVVVGLLVGLVFALDVARVQVPSDFITTLEVGTTFGNLGLLTQGSILVSVLTMALVASAETMLCATATDRLHDGERTDYDKELRAQGIGNMVCGMLGALPVTGVIVRSSANIESGGATRRSAILHGFWLLLFIAALPFVLNQIPVSALAAILVYIGYKLVNPQAIKKLYQTQGAGEVAVFAVTLGTIVATNLLTGILVGFGLAALKLLYGATRLHVEVQEGEERNEVWLHGAATFLGLPELASSLESIPMQTHVEIHLDHLTYADAACLDFLTGYERRHTDLGGSVHVCWETLRQRKTGASDDLTATRKAEREANAESARLEELEVAPARS